jgi:hypothetical protein
LKKTWFYVFEFSIILQEKSSQIIGSGILSSLPQLRKFRSGDFCVTKYDRNAIFESKISFNGEPNFFMGFNRFDELGVALIEIKRYINL